jgi:selenide,water dikinase
MRARADILARMVERTPIRLTQYCQAAGCAAKLAPDDLEWLLEELAPAATESFASGVGSRDDAGWIEFGSGLLLQSVDFFPPIVDDPRRFGQIAAANALSDIYAMGGEPLTAMNLVGFPAELALDVLREIVEGGMEKIAESGAVVCGGHSVRDSEPKYGVAVTGFVERERLVRNQGARPGDTLVLTKPLGIGILATAVKQDLLEEGEIEDALDVAAWLNRAARDAIQDVGVSAATDVTGYGLLGHLVEMVEPAGHGAQISRGGVPVWDRAAELGAQGCFPGGLESNRDYLDDRMTSEGVAEADLLPLFDPQTSGGLLIAVAPERLEDLTGRLAAGGDQAAVIGEVFADPGIRVVA